MGRVKQNRCKVPAENLRIWQASPFAVNFSNVHQNPRVTDILNSQVHVHQKDQETIRGNWQTNLCMMWYVWVSNSTKYQISHDEI